MRTVLLAVAWVVAFCTLGFAQVQSGTVFGTLTNEEGAVLPGTSVALNSRDGMESLTTDTEGGYRFLKVPPGSYTITAVLQGFKAFVRNDIVVVVGQDVGIPIVLSVAMINEPPLVVGGSPGALGLRAPENHAGQPRRPREHRRQ